MNKRILKESEVQDFVEQLYAENRWAISISRDPESDDYLIKWVEHKKYVSYTGETHPDEIWQTEDGTMMCIQDMEPEHARNALRMLVRQQRLMQELLINQLTSDLSGDQDDLEDLSAEAEESQYQDLLNESPFYHGKKPTIQ